MEVNKLWKNNDINKYYIISLDKETNEWKFFREIVGHTVFWKDEPSRYGMTKSKAIEVLNIVKSLTNEDIKPENNNGTETEPETPTTQTENEGESGTTTPTTEPTEPSGENNGAGETTPSDTPTEPSESDNSHSTDTNGETSTGENESGETLSTNDTEPNTEPSTPTGEPTEPVTPVKPETPTTPTEEPQYKIITISSVTYSSEEVPIFDDADYHKLKTTLTYIDTTYPNDNVHVVVAEENAGKSIFYFYLEEELTWFLELRTNIDYTLVNNITTLDDIKELL